MTKPKQHRITEAIMAGLNAPKVTEPAPVDDLLLAALDWEYPEAWKPEAAGDTIAGTFEKLTYGPDHFTADQVPVANLRLDDGTRKAVWMFHKVARQQFREAAPEPGERVAFRYLGERSSADGTKYQDWRVRSAHQVKASPIDWDRFAGVDLPDS